jgi:hypothetical protein
MPKVGAEFGAVLDDRTAPADYRTLTMPVRLLGGDRSPLPVQMILDRLETLLPRADRVTLAGLGHMGPVQAPERIALALPAIVRDGGESTSDERFGDEPLGKPMPDVHVTHVAHGAARRTRPPEVRVRPLLMLAVAVIALASSPLWVAGPRASTALLAPAAAPLRVASKPGAGPPRIDVDSGASAPSVPDATHALGPLADVRQALGLTGDAPPRSDRPV